LHLVFGKYYFIQHEDSVAVCGGNSRAVSDGGKYAYKKGAARSARVVGRIFRRVEGTGAGIGTQSEWEELLVDDPDFLKVKEVLEGRSAKPVAHGWSRRISCGDPGVDRLVRNVGIEVYGVMPKPDGHGKRPV
jgi:hypothetical protein